MMRWIEMVGLVALLGAAAAAGCGGDSRSGSRQSAAGAGGADGCRASRDCPGGQVCDADTGECVECVRNSECADDEVCIDRECVPAGVGGGASAAVGGTTGSGGSDDGGGAGEGGALPEGGAPSAAGSAGAAGLGMSGSSGTIGAAGMAGTPGAAGTSGAAGAAGIDAGGAGFGGGAGMAGAGPTGGSGPTAGAGGAGGAGAPVCGNGVLEDGETCDDLPITCGECERVLTPLIWLDAADSDTIVTDSVGDITVWQDKSGNDNHMQPIAAGGPRIGAAINGQDTVVFSGADAMTVPGSENTVSGDFTALVVVSINGNASHHTIFGKAADVFGNNEAELDWGFGGDTDDTFRVLVTQDTGGVTTRVISSTFNVQQAYVLAATWSGGDTLRGYRDGARFGEVVSAVTVGNSHPLCLGGYTTAHPERRLEGNVAEAIAYEEALSDAELAAINQYLMDKWL